MKRAKRTPFFKPRDLVSQSPLLKKGGRHQRIDKRASRARRKTQQRREIDET